MMKTIAGVALIALYLASPASAHDPWEHRGWHGPHEHWHGPGPGALLGLGAAAIAGGLLAAPYLAQPAPYPPPPPAYYVPFHEPPAPPPYCWIDRQGYKSCRSF